MVTVENFSRASVSDPHPKRFAYHIQRNLFD